jgi:DNA-binding transcriptional regulator YiaG
VGRVDEAVRSAVQRVVQRELRSAIAPLSKDVEALQRSVSELEKTVASLSRTPARAAGGPVPKIEATETEIKRARITPALVKKLRARLGITQAELAAIVGVTGPAIAQWEGGSSEPRGENRAVVVGLRKLGRRDVERILDASGLAARRSRRTARAAKKSAKKTR